MFLIFSLEVRKELEVLLEKSEKSGKTQAQFVQEKRTIEKAKSELVYKSKFDLKETFKAFENGKNFKNFQIFGKMKVVVK